MLSKPELLRQLRAWNPWWQEGATGIQRFGVPDFKRKEYHQIQTLYRQRTQAISIVGMRQIGKTTIMHQSIQELLEAGVEPKHIFFISFEDSYLLAKYDHTTLFHDVIDAYAESVLKEDLGTTNAKLYFYFDEVHRLPRWAQSIKSYIDRHAPIAFMVSGSASVGMRVTKGDSLLGRMVEFTLYPFSFSEAVRYWSEPQKKTKEDSQQLENLLLRVNEAGRKQFYQDRLQTLFQDLQSPYQDLATWYDSELRQWLHRYLTEGGFPRVWQQTDEYSRYRYLVEQHIQKVIREDLPQLAKIRKVSELEALYIQILEGIGNERVLHELARGANITMVTLENYIRYLKQSFLIFAVERTKSKVIAQRRASRVKFYAVDPSVRAAVLKTRDDLFTRPDEMGVYAENLVASALSRRLAGQVGNTLRYYRESNKYEVDFIVKEADSILPVEVKWRDTVPSLSSLDRLCRRWNLTESVLVTRDNALTYKDGRLSMPLWLFLLAMG